MHISKNDKKPFLPLNRKPSWQGREPFICLQFALRAIYFPPSCLLPSPLLMLFSLLVTGPKIFFLLLSDLLLFPFVASRFRVNRSISYPSLLTRKVSVAKPAVGLMRTPWQVTSCPPPAALTLLFNLGALTTASRCGPVRAHLAWGPLSLPGLYVLTLRQVAEVLCHYSFALALSPSLSVSGRGCPHDAYVSTSDDVPDAS